MKLINKLLKIEELINAALRKIFKYSILKIKTLTPKRVKKWITNSRSFFSARILTLKVKKDQFVSLLRIKAQLLKSNVQTLKRKAIEFPYRSTVINKIKVNKEFLLKQNPASLKIKLTNFFKINLCKIQVHLTKYNLNYKFSNSSIVILIFAMMGVGLFGIYKSGRGIYLRETFVRQPASVPELRKTSKHHRLPKRTLKVQSVRIPVLYKKVSSIKSVTIDFTLTTDNRFSRKFLETYKYKLKDYFYVTVDPIDSSFLLNEEGKDILKEKIKRELNLFLKKEKVEGKVLEVNIIDIIAS